MNSNIANNLPEAENKSFNSCSEGGHQYIIDDQIGIICKFCHHVQLEIRCILPPLMTNVARKSKKTNSDEEGNASLLGAAFSQEVNVFPCNYSRPSKGTVWDMIPGVKNEMHNYQIEGFEFLWYNLARGVTLDKLKPEGSEGIGGYLKKWKVDLSLYILKIDAFFGEEDVAISTLEISYELFSKLTMEEHKAKDERRYKEVQSSYLKNQDYYS
ncbi:hypothetical protein AMTRI_Chr09g21660 [Amborella trichopoda]